MSKPRSLILFYTTYFDRTEVIRRDKHSVIMLTSLMLTFSGQTIKYSLFSYDVYSSWRLRQDTVRHATSLLTVSLHTYNQLIET
jgi:hypothetical protein